MFIRKARWTWLTEKLKKEMENNEILKSKLKESEEKQNLYRNIFFDGIESFINAAYEPPAPKKDSAYSKDCCSICFQTISEEDSIRESIGKLVPDELKVILKTVEDSFSDKLLELIRKKNLNEVEVYKKADLDRRHFSKIRSNSSYRPKKDTVILLCLSMNLSLEEAQDLLERAGLTLSRSSRQDLIATYFLKRKIYDVLLYKEVLSDFGIINE